MTAKRRTRLAKSNLKADEIDWIGVEAALKEAREIANTALYIATETNARLSLVHSLRLVGDNSTAERDSHKLGELLPKIA